jgi:hypothetical protein
MAEPFFSSLWRILELYGCAQLDSERALARRGGVIGDGVPVGVIARMFLSAGGVELSGGCGTGLFGN